MKITKVWIILWIVIFCIACESRNIDKRKTHKFINLQKRFTKLAEKLSQRNEQLYKKIYRETALIQDSTKVNTIKVQLDFLADETRNILLKTRQLTEFLRQKYGGKPNKVTVLDNFALRNEIAYEMIENKKGYELENQLNEYVEFLNLQFLDIYKIERFLLLTDAKKSFVKENFGFMTLIGTLSILSQKQVRILQYEQNVLQKVLAEMNPKLSSEKLLVWLNTSTQDSLELGKVYQFGAESFFQTSLKKALLIVKEDSIRMMTDKAEFEAFYEDSISIQGKVILPYKEYDFEVR